MEWSWNCLCSPIQRHCVCLSSSPTRAQETWRRALIAPLLLERKLECKMGTHQWKNGKIKPGIIIWWFTPSWVAGAQTLGAVPAAFPGALAELIWNGAAVTPNGTPVEWRALNSSSYKTDSGWWAGIYFHSTSLWFDVTDFPPKPLNVQLCLAQWLLFGPRAC